MELKKSKKADLEKKKGLFLQIGFIGAIGLVLLAFEWTSTPKEAQGFSRDDQSDLVQENVPVTRQEERKPPPPPPPQTTDILNIVDNDVQIEDELILEETEADQDTRVQINAFMEEEEEITDEVFVVVEDMPSFKGGGLSAFTRYVQQRLVYPSIAQENGIQGTVFIRFIVGKEGSISNVEILRGVDPSLDNAAQVAVSEAPAWEPGMQRGKPVRVSCTIPINFTLE